MNTAALRVVARYQQHTAGRVAFRFKEAGFGEGKFLGRDARLTWDRHGYLLEELPQKGKKKLRVTSWQNLDGRGWQERAWGNLIPDNVLRDARLSKSDSYEKIKSKLTDALEAAANKTNEELPPDRGGSWVVDSVKGHEKQVHYLKIVPEGTEPFTAEGKDFTVKVEWTTFRAYDPKADLQSHDPSYTLYEASSAAAGRKMYRILNGDPNALKSVPWAKFSDWLNKNKIGYKTRFSVYR
jgi:hypothetical protein